SVRPPPPDRRCLSPRRSQYQRPTDRRGGSSTGITMYIAHRREGSPWQDEVGSPEGFYALYELRKAGSFDLEQPCIFPADGRRAYGTLEGVLVEILARGDSDDTPQDVVITTRTTWTPSSTAY